MPASSLRRRFQRLNIWRRGGERAPHKPLLVLYALGRLSRGEYGRIPFSEVDPVLHELLAEFGPPRKSHHPEYPFWRLQNDGIWALDRTTGLTLREGHTDAKKSELLKYDVSGGFTPEVERALRKDPALLRDIAQDTLDANFPESLHDDILAAVGLDLRPAAHGRQRPRDAQFRARVMTAYGHRCAVCGFDVRIGRQTVALEAAHVMWHQAGGPDEVDNGVALCALHHKVFDLGTFTISRRRAIEVSEQVHGTTGLAETLLRFHGQPLRPPVNPAYAVHERYLLWHERQVFRGPARYHA